jgi:hypothetical protein
VFINCQSRVDKQCTLQWTLQLALFELLFSLDLLQETGDVFESFIKLLPLQNRSNVDTLHVDLIDILLNLFVADLLLLLGKTADF